MKSGSALVALAFLALAGCEQAAVEEAVARQMRDPDSTQFRHVKQCAGDRSVWHGEYNAKNGFGAYVGFEPFYYSENTVTTLESGGFEEMMNRCFGKALPTGPAIEGRESSFPAQDSREKSGTDVKFRIT